MTGAVRFQMSCGPNPLDGHLGIETGEFLTKMQEETNKNKGKLKGKSPSKIKDQTGSGGEDRERDFRF